MNEIEALANRHYAQRDACCLANTAVDLLVASIVFNVNILVFDGERWLVYNSGIRKDGDVGFLQPASLITLFQPV